MKVLFLGYAINIEEASKTYGASIAGNKMQINVLKNLDAYPDLSIKSITIYPIAAYPGTKTMFIKKQLINLFNDFYSIKIRFVNLPVIKHFCIIINTYIEAKKLVKKDGIQTIFTFNCFPEVGLPAKWLKKKYGCTIISLLADLPIDDTVSRKGFSLLLRKCFDKITKNTIPCYDKLIVLNKHAVELYAPDVTNIVVEGGVDEDDITEFSNRKFIKKNIVYSGALVEYSGIMNLIESMKFITHKDVFLDIYGGGQIEELVKSQAEKMPNVFFHGKVDNNSMKKIQHEAYLLVNPRPVENKIAMVTFPSKIFEYMLSGTPVLTTKLNGFTDEYLDKMYFVDQNDPYALAGKINEIMDLPEDELRGKAYAARQFIIENKTWEKQSKKIYEFVKVI